MSWLGKKVNLPVIKNGPQKFMSSTEFYREYCKKRSGLKKKINIPKMPKEKN